MDGPSHERRSVAEAKAEADRGPARSGAPRRRAPAATGSSMVVGAVDDHAERDADAIAAAVLRSLRDDTAAPTPAGDADHASRIRRAPARTTGASDLDGEIDHDGEDLSDATGSHPSAEVREHESTMGGGAGGGESEGGASGEEAPGHDGSRVRRVAGVARVDRVARDEGASTPAPGTGPEGGVLDVGIANRIRRASSGGRPIDEQVRSRIQPAFGTDLSQVRVHTDRGSDELNRSINARAFTVGRNVFFSAGQYRPGSSSGMGLLAHELAHVEQADGGGRRSARRSTVIHRRFQPGVTTSKAHLRQRDDWSNFHGPAITPGTSILLDDQAGNQVVQKRTALPDVTWVPAINMPPDHRGPVAGDRVGYIRKGRAAQWGSLSKQYGRTIADILRAAEQRVPGDVLKDHLNKPEHVDLLIDKALRLESWNPDNGSLAAFTSGLGTVQAKLDRIREGAEHVADSIEHWRKWLHPDDPDWVDVDDVKLLGSDLHQHGLGVVAVRFTKLQGGQPMFADKRSVEAIIKPEDKSLEKSLLGSQSDSAANQVNKLAGLTGNERLGTINMEVANIAPRGATPVYSTLVERVRGESSEDFATRMGSTKGQGAFAVTPSFHETLVFSFLAGIDDLHWENVMWVGGTPYLIDADSVMMHGQMTKSGTGDADQSGFSTMNKQEAEDNREGIKTKDPAKAKSKILQTLVSDATARGKIIAAIKSAIRGHKGRTVPLYTDRWGVLLRSYQAMADDQKDGWLTFYSSRNEIVRENRAIDGKIGPGLAGTTGVNTAQDVYHADVEKAQLKKDMDSGVIPFYEYDYDTGHVTHNGAHIFNGLTLDLAFTQLAARFA